MCVHSGLPVLNGLKSGWVGGARTQDAQEGHTQALPPRPQLSMRGQASSCVVALSALGFTCPAGRDDACVTASLPLLVSAARPVHWKSKGFPDSSCFNCQPVILACTIGFCYVDVTRAAEEGRGTAGGSCGGFPPKMQCTT